MQKRKRHPLNADGDFFVEYDVCLACDAPKGEAPDLIEYDEDMHCYFKRQPETPEEIEQAINAVRCSCVEAVLYDGDDPEIRRKIKGEP
ncbi:MAG: ferredoxin [Pyrinomonadaceae bacterium]